MYYGDAEGQRHIYFSKTYSMGHHYLYQSEQNKNVSKYTLLNECNVKTRQEYNLTAECLLFVSFYWGVTTESTNRHDVHLPGLEINQLSKQSGFHTSLFVFFTFICLSEAHWRRSESVHKLHQGLLSWWRCAGIALNVNVIRHQIKNYYVSSFISNEKKSLTMTDP